MKSKKLKYILLPLVFIIWGIIIVRIIAYLKPTNEDVILPLPQKKETTRSKEEHFELLMNYKDPFVSPRKASQTFTGVSSSSSSYEESFYTNQTTNSKNRKTSTKNASKPNTQSKNTTKQDNLLDVKYLGMVNNSNPEKQTAYIVFENDYILCEPGETVKDITIQSFTKDHINILSNDSIYVFKKSIYE